MESFFADLIQLAEDSPFAAASTTATERYEDLFSLVRRRIHKKRSVGRVHLDLGKGVRIGVSAYNLAQKAYKYDILYHS